MQVNPQKLPAFVSPAAVPALCAARDDFAKGRVSFDRLLRIYLDAQGLSYPVFGWFYANRQQLSDWLRGADDGRN